MSHEVSPEKARAIIAEKLNYFVLNYADAKKYAEIMENRPMIEKERLKYDKLTRLSQTCTRKVNYKEAENQPDG